MNVLRLLLGASLCLASDARTANQTHHDVCDWHCTVKDFATVAKTFSRLISEEKARIIDLTINAHTDSNSSLCNSTVQNPSDFHPTWAVAESEPYLFIRPEEFTLIPEFYSSSQPKQRMEIDFNCDGKAQEIARPGKLDETSALENAVAWGLIQDLMQEKGVLCFFRESGDGIMSQKCCHFDKLVSEITCNTVQSTITQLVDASRTFWTVVSVIMTIYLPAIICLFPSLPKVSEDGTPCIELEDPSPAALRSLLVKALGPRNTDSFLGRARLFFLKVVLLPGVASISIFLSGFPFPTIPTENYAIFGFFWLLYTIHAITDLAVPSSPSRSDDCSLCGKPAGHLDLRFTIAKHMKAQLSHITSACRELSVSFFEHIKSCIFFPLSFKSPKTVSCSLGRIFFSLPLFFVELIIFLAFCVFVIYSILLISSPLMTVCDHGSSRGENAVRRTLSVAGKYGIVFGTMYVLLCWGMVFAHWFMMAIDLSDTVFPILALSALTLSYLCSCFSSPSEKHQLLKLKLSENMDEHVNNGGDSLYVYTKAGAPAIPEDLYEMACRELEMTMIETLWQAFMKVACFMIIAIPIFISIMIFAPGTKAPPYAKVLVIFFAGSLPKLVSVLSSGEYDRELEKKSMELRLKQVIPRYVQAKETESPERLELESMTLRETKC